MSPTKSYASPAARALLSEGVTQAEVAMFMAVGRRSVGHWLDGSVRPPERLPEVLDRLIGDEAASNVLSRIPATAR